MREPGPPDAKIDMLSGVSPDTFPWLIADILALREGHSQVVVTDGPGDGRRDIHSVNAEGVRVVTQCKFSMGREAISSRATDEIVIALEKFGATNGILATNGHFSPQSKREVLEDFPRYNLQVWEGPDVLDAILAEPLIRGAWFDGNRVGRRFSVITVPMVVVAIEADRFISLAPPWQHHGHDLIPISRLEPFRPPEEGELYGGFGSLVDGLIYTEEVDAISQWKDVYSRATSFLKDSKSLRASVRIGTVAWEAGKDSNLSETLSSANTRILFDGTDSSERSWVLPRPKGALYPHEIRATTHDWARIYVPDYDILVNLEVAAPPDVGQREILEIITRENSRLLRELSVFIFVPQSRVPTEISSLVDRIPPNFQTKVSDSTTIIGWVHPEVNAIFRSLPTRGVHREKAGPIQSIEDARAALRAAGAEFVAPDLVTALVANKHPQFQGLKEILYGLTDMWYSWEIIPSPIRLERRRFVLERAWLFKSVHDTAIVPETVDTTDSDWRVTVELISAADLPNAGSSRGVGGVICRAEAEPGSALSSTAWLEQKIESGRESLDLLASKFAQDDFAPKSTREVWELLIGYFFVSEPQVSWSLD